MSEIVDDTVGAVKAHPWLIGGGVVAALLVFWALSRGSPAKPQNFTFSYGPSDAQIAAGTQLAMDQADNSAKTSIAQSYFQYLTQASGNTLAAATINSNNAMSTQVDVAQIASNTALGQARLSADVANNQAYTGLWAQQSHDQLASQTSIALGSQQQQTAMFQAASTEQTAIAQANLYASVSDQQIWSTAQTQQFHDASAEQTAIALGRYS